MEEDKVVSQNDEVAQTFTSYVKTHMEDLGVNPLSANPHEMVKHTQTIRRLLQTNCLSVFDHFVGLALKELKVIYI